MTNDVKFEKGEKRILKMLALFAVLILVAQVLQYFNSRRSETDYRKMSASSMHIVVASQNIMVETTNVQRTLRSLIDIGNPNDVIVFKELLENSFPAIQSKIVSIETSMFSSRQLAKKNEMALLTKAYEKTCNDFLAVYESDKTKAFEYRNTVVRPAFEKCQQAQTDLITILNSDLQTESDRIAVASNRTSLVILLLGISPFLLLLAYLLFQSSRILYYELFS